MTARISRSRSAAELSQLEGLDEAAQGPLRPLEPAQFSCAPPRDPAGAHAEDPAGAHAGGHAEAQAGSGPERPLPIEKGPRSELQIPPRVGEPPKKPGERRTSPETGSGSTAKEPHARRASPETASGSKAKAELTSRGRESRLSALDILFGESSGGKNRGLGGRLAHAFAGLRALVRDARSAEAQPSALREVSSIPVASPSGETGADGQPDPWQGIPVAPPAALEDLLRGSRRAPGSEGNLASGRLAAREVEADVAPSSPGDAPSAAWRPKPRVQFQAWIPAAPDVVPRWKGGARVAD